MRALVTGGAGFIGSNVVGHLLEKGLAITVLDNFSTGTEGNLPSPGAIRVIRGDIRDPEAIDEALREVEVVFHLAASVGNLRSTQEPRLDAEINVLGTLQLLEGMRNHRVGKLIFSSSSAIYGEPRHLPINEEHPVEPASPYGVSKLAAEKHCLCYMRLYGWHVACMRYFNVYGRNQRYDAYGNVIPIFAQRLLSAQPMIIFGDGEQTRDFIDVGDVARANWVALQAGVSGAFNVGSGVATTINDLARLARACAAGRSEILYEPPRPADVRHSVSDIRSIRGRLGFLPAVGLEEGLRSYIAWLANA